MKHVPPTPAPVAAGAPIRLVLADDDELARAAIALRLCEFDDLAVVGEAGDGSQLLAAVEALQPDLVLTDITMPVMDGITAAARIRDRFASVRVVMVSMHDTGGFLERAIAAGAHGYLRKDVSGAELHRAIHTVMAGTPYVASVIARSVAAVREAATPMVGPAS
jgi:DNA-binding NarL/FixJ family response regulator